MSIKLIIAKPIAWALPFRPLSKKLGYKGIRRMAVLCDMLYCRLAYHCHADEYELYRFDLLKNRKRKYYLLKKDQYGTYAKINFGILATGKGGQYETLGQSLVKREWLRVDEVDFDTVQGFAERNKTILFKPNHGSCGIGIFVYNIEEGKDALIRALASVQGQNYICEQYIVQHPTVASLHPGSVNTVRILSLFDGTDVQLLAATLKIGISDCVVDNIRHDGLGAAIDLKTGIITTPGYDFDRNEYMCHPETGVQIIGMQIPNWDKVLETVRRGARVIDRNPLLGWDIAVTENDACVIEFNNRPGTRIIQMYDMVPKGEPIYRYMKENPEKLRKLNRLVRKRIAAKIR